MHNQTLKGTYRFADFEIWFEYGIAKVHVIEGRNAGVPSKLMVSDSPLQNLVVAL